MLTSPVLALAGLIAVASGACAADATSPFILRSSGLPPAENHALVGKVHADATEVYQAMTSLGCDWDALIVVDIEKLHHTHLTTFQSQLTTSPTSLLDIPHVKRTSSEDLQMAAEALVKSCSSSEGEGKVLVNVKGGAGEDVNAPIADAVTAYTSHLILFHGTSPSTENSKRQLLPPTDEGLAEAVTEVEADFAAESADADTAEESTWVEEAEDLLEEWFPSLTGGHKADDAEEVNTLLKGGAYDDDEEDSNEDDNADGYWDMLEETEKNGNGSSNSTLPLFQRAQILSTPVITALLVSFGILIPILVMGVYALTTIQVPPYMMSIAKTGISQQKKDQ